MQTAINLAEPLNKRGVKIVGTDCDAIDKAENRAKEIKAAGAIFIGHWTPEPAGDFTAGPSHVLPTGGTARFFHGLTVMDFLRRSSLVQYTQEALAREVPAIVKFAELEGLDAHGNSAAIRCRKES